MAPPGGVPWRIDLGYDGTDFFGSQRQPGARTVQAELEAALARLTGQECRVALAGRTDRGVHAVGQVASVRLDWRRSPESLTSALRALAPDDLVIYRVTPADERFHARYSARRREYRYRIWTGSRPPLLSRRYVWHLRRPPDVARMAEAAAGLIGTHDLAALAGGGKGMPWSGLDCVRTVFRAEWRQIEPAIEPAALAGGLIEFRVEASGYLPRMARNMVGSLVAIGRQERPIAWLEELLAGRDRRAAPAPAPPHGLVLWRITYDEGDTAGVVADEAPEKKQGVVSDEDVFSKGV